MNANAKAPTVTPAQAIDILEAQIAEVRKSHPLQKVARAELALGTALAILRALEVRQSQVIARLCALEVCIGADTDVGDGQ
jgi:hypothetical protein